MNPIGELIAEDDIVLGLDVPDKRRLLEAIASMLARKQSLAAIEVLASLEAREELGSTGLGHGVAIPHARMAQCDAAAAVLVRTTSPIEFAAPDRRPVALFLGLIVPKQANERHLKLLATAAGMFNDRDFRHRLITCGDRQAARELLAAWPDAQMPAQPPTI